MIHVKFVHKCSFAPALAVQTPTPPWCVNKSEIVVILKLQIFKGLKLPVKLSQWHCWLITSRSSRPKTVSVKSSRQKHGPWALWLPSQNTLAVVWRWPWRPGGSGRCWLPAKPCDSAFICCLLRLSTTWRLRILSHSLFSLLPSGNRYSSICCHVSGPKGLRLGFGCMALCCRMTIKWTSKTNIS